MKKIFRYSFLAILFTLGITLILLWRPDLKKSYLEDKYGQDSSQFLNIEGARIHLRDTGNPNGPAIIFIHGFGASLHTWEDWSRSLEKEFRVIRFDLPGFGLTGPDTKMDYSDDRSNQILIKLMDTLHVKKATVIGNSIGGRIAWYFASRYPERVEKLVLISPDGFESPGLNYNTKPEIPAYWDLINFIFPKFLFKQNLEIAYTNKGVLSDQLFERYYELALYPGNRQAMLDRMRQTVLQDPTLFLKDIRCPILLLWGENDAMIPIKNAQDYLALVPQAKLQTLTKLGHLPQEEAPRESLPYLISFLKN